MVVGAGKDNSGARLRASPEPPPGPRTRRQGRHIEPSAQRRQRSRAATNLGLVFMGVAPCVQRTLEGLPAPIECALPQIGIREFTGFSHLDDFAVARRLDRVNGCALRPLSAPRAVYQATARALASSGTPEHPEPTPEPSGTDERFAVDNARATISVLNGLAFVIAGNQSFPTGWYVGFHDRNQFYGALPRDALSTV